MEPPTIPSSRDWVFEVSLPVARTSTFWRIVHVTGSPRLILPSSSGKLKVPITSTWSFGLIIPLTDAAPFTLMDIARIWRFTSAESPFARGSPPSTSLQKTTSLALCPTMILRPKTSASSVTAWPRSPSAGARRGSMSAFESTVPDGTSRLNVMTSMVPYFFISRSFSARISFSLTVRYVRVRSAAMRPATSEIMRTTCRFIRRALSPFLFQRRRRCGGRPATPMFPA